ncbi:hypothetical protein ETH_00018605 [Eimeria tenella]|nr:hypothetical protein ETH_00018605 [Eimeria tenella]CDJ42462.1 hypothetical protein ETH_00018605 [Eimeria tenella]|eukprot:XP_013233212.1 hypothetical protein ETH_00018605 [Eimeria tenella]
MNPQANPQYRNDLSSSRTTDQTVGSISCLQRKTEHSSVDDKFLIQSLSKKKLSSSPWARHLGVAITFLAAAYLLLVCFQFIEARKLSARQTRSLADRHDGSCDWESAADDSDNGGDRSRQGREQQLSEEGLWLSQHEAHGAHENEASGPGEVDVEMSTGEEAKGTKLGYWSQELARHNIMSWSRRNLPPPVHRSLVDMFSRMVRAARLCKALLPKLTCAQRLQLTYQMMRLIALDLGAISLVREDLEPARQSVGDSLISLGLECLERSGVDPRHETQRASIRQLMGLVDKLKQHRPLQEDFGPVMYRIKMVSLMGTAGVVLKYCLGVLDGLLQRSYGQQSAPPEAVVQQQLNVIKALYRVHSDHIARDAEVCEHILRTQQQTGIYELLDSQQASLNNVSISKLVQLKNKIKDAVRSAGGLLKYQGPTPRRSEALRDHSASSMFSRDSEPTNIIPEAPHGTLGQQMLHERSAEDTGRVFDSAAVSSSKSMHGGTPFLPGAVPQWSASQPSHQGAEPAAQPLPQLESRPLDHQPQWVMSKTLEQSPGSWTSWLHAAHQPFHSPERHQPQEPSFPARSVDRVAPQFAPGGFSAGPIGRPAATGRDIGPLLAPTTQLLQRTPVDSSARLHSSAAGPHTREYSLFGGGGTFPWSPFSLMSATSVEEQAAAGRGWVDAQMQDMRDPSTDDLDESESRQRSGRLEFGHQ